jgi:hypothetical protein
MEEGSFAAYGVSNAPELIEILTVAIATRERPLMLPLLRGIVDTIETQGVPPEALPSNADKRRQYFDHRYGVTDPKKGKVVLLGPDGTRLTGFRKPCVVSTCAQRPMISVNYPLRLASADAVKVHADWLAGNRVAAIWSNADEVIEPDDTDAGGYQLAFRNAATNRSEFLRFQKLDQKVVEFKRPEFKPSWRAEVDADWLHDLGEQFAKKWFGAGGQHNFIVREDHKVLSVMISAYQLSILFDRQSATETFPWIARSDDPSPHETQYASADLGPVLYRLSQARTESAVLSGNQHALVIEFETTTGSFHIAVPTLKADGKRDATLFGEAA